MWWRSICGCSCYYCGCGGGSGCSGGGGLNGGGGGYVDVGGRMDCWSVNGFPGSPTAQS